jgi:hypothetical protein
LDLIFPDFPADFSGVSDDFFCIFGLKNIHRRLIPFEERQYCQTFAIYMEGLFPFTIKMSMNGKHGKWNKSKKN